MDEFDAYLARKGGGSSEEDELDAYLAKKGVSLTAPAPAAPPAPRMSEAGPYADGLRKRGPGPWRDEYDDVPPDPPAAPPRRGPGKAETFAREFVEGAIPGAHASVGIRRAAPEVGPKYDPISRANPFAGPTAADERASLPPEVAAAVMRKRVEESTEPLREGRGRPTSSLGPRYNPGQRANPFAGPTADDDAGSVPAADLPTQGNPISAFAGGTLGSIFGVPGRLMKGAEGLIGKIPWIGGQGTGFVSSATRGTGRGLATYEATAPAATAAATFAEGGSVDDALKTARDAALNPIGLILSGAGGTAGNLGSRHAARSADPKRASGRTLEDVKAAGGRVQAFGDEPVKGGQFDGMAGLPEAREGVNRVADKAGQTFTRYNRKALAKARGEFGRDMGAVMDELPSRVPTTPLRDVVDGVRQSVLVNGKVPPQYDKLDDAVTRVKDMLQRDGVEEGFRMQGGGLNEKGVLIPYEMRPFVDKVADNTIAPRELLKVKQAVQEAAEFHMPATAENRPYRLLYHAIADHAGKLDPRIAAINAKFKKTLDKLEEANDKVYGKDTSDIAGRAAEERSATGFFGRMGDPSQAGTTRSRHADELMELDPMYRALGVRVKAKKAQENLRYNNEGANQAPIEQIGGQGARGAIATMLNLSPRNRDIASLRLTHGDLPGIKKSAAEVAGGARRALPPLTPLMIMQLLKGGHRLPSLTGEKRE